VWSSEHPTQDGWYWFYGRLSAADEPTILPVRVHLLLGVFGERCTYYHAAFFEGQSIKEGFWLPMPTPELPREITVKNNDSGTTFVWGGE
jgi:hypothetical protein